MMLNISKITGSEWPLTVKERDPCSKKLWSYLCFVILIFSSLFSTGISKNYLSWILHNSSILRLWKIFFQKLLANSLSGKGIQMLITKSSVLISRGKTQVPMMIVRMDCQVNSMNLLKINLTKGTNRKMRTQIKCLKNTKINWKNLMKSWSSTSFLKIKPRNIKIDSKWPGIKPSKN